MKSLRMLCRTGMDWFAHSMRFLPCSASSMFLMSQAIVGAVVVAIWFLVSHFLFFVNVKILFQSLRRHLAAADDRLLAGEIYFAADLELMSACSFRAAALSVASQVKSAS